MLQLTIIGHIGGDAEIKNSNGHEFTTFRVAHTERWTDASGMKMERTIWVDCIINGKPNVFEYLKQGQMVYCVGTCSTRVYSSAKDKCMKAGLTINVRNVELLGSKKDDIPARLLDVETNTLVDVWKLYYAQSMRRDPTAAEYKHLQDSRGTQYKVDRDGWITKVEDKNE